MEHSKPAFLLAEAESSGVKVSRFHGATDEVREAPHPIRRRVCYFPAEALVCCNTERRLASRRVSPLAAFAKKILQNRSTLFLQNTRCNFAPVIKGRHLQEVHHASGGSGRQICAAEDHAADSRVHDRACAHCARFFGHIKIAIRQTPIANGRFSLCQRHHFGVRRRVLEQLDLVMRAPDDFVLAHNHGAHRHFVRSVRFLPLSQCFTHEIFVGQRFEHL